MAYSHIPTFVAKGAFTNGVAALTVAVPAGYRNDDLLLLFTESANQAITAPTGWTEVGAQASQGTGTAAAAGGVRLAVFWKLATGQEASVTVADSGDHTTAIMMAFRGVNPLSPFGSATPVSKIDSTATTAMSWPTLTTTTANNLIVMAAALDADAASTAAVGAMTAASLTSIVEQHDQTVIDGAGGGITVSTAVKATAGAIGTMTATGSTSTTHGYLTMALQGRSDADIVPRGQYKIDLTTPVPIGGSVTPITDGIYTLADISPVWQTDNAITPKIEVQTIANSFANTATVTNAAMKPETTDVTYSSRGGNLIYDTKNDRYILFGGYDGTTRYNLVWAKDMTTPGRPWRKLAPTGTPPTAKNLAAATYFRGNKTTGGADTAVMIVWGGNIGASDTNEMHILDVTTPGSEAWTVVTQTTPPSARSYITKHMVAVPVTGDTSQATVYLFGGWAAARENQLVKCTIDLDTLTATTWSTLKATGTAGNPSIRSGTVMDYKASTNKLYIYGGYNGTTYLSDFWSYDITGNSFTQETVTGSAPQGAELGAGGFDATNNRFWFTGGWSSAASTGNHNHIGYVSSVGSSASYVAVRADDNDNQAYAQHSSSASTIDTKRGWLVIYTMLTYDSTERYSFVIDLNDGITSGKPVYGLNDAEWMQPRDAPSSVYDTSAGEWLAISGFSGMGDEVTIASGTHVNDIWSYDQTNNRWRYASKGYLGMPHTEGLTAVYDSTRNRIIAFGGLSGISETSNEVWSATRDANGLYQWAKLAPTGTPPISRWLCTAVFDSANNRALFVMGGDKSTQFTDVWEISFSSSADGVWTQRTATGTPPTAVVGAGFAAKTSNTRLYIHGGATVPALTTVSAQLVYLDYSTTATAWTAPTSSAGTARRTPGLGYDPTNDRLVTFGGFNGTNSIQALQYWNVATPGAWSAAATTTLIPDAKRSLGYTFANNKFLITHGRSDSSPWYSTTWELTPNYGTPNSSTWVNKYPRRSQPHYFLYDPNAGGGYHWQVWDTEETVDQTKQSFGGNLETVADFYLGTPPTVALNSPADASSSSLTPSLNFTGTDVDSDPVSYEIQIDTVNTFDSQTSNATPAFVQATTGDFTASPFTSTAFGSSVTVGNYIIAAFGGDSNATGIVLTVTDNKGNTYTRLPSYDYAIGTTDWLNMDLWYAKVVTGGASLQVTGTYNAVASNISVIAQEFSGITATSPADKTAHATGTSTAPSSGNTATLAQAAELVIGHSVHALTVSAYSLGSGYTNLTQVSVANRQHAMESKVVNATTAVAATFSIAASREWIAAVSTFKAGTVPGGPLIDKLSASDFGFIDTTTQTNIDPFTSGDAVSYLAGYGADTYYFNASDAAPTDPNAAWAGDANGFDGSTGTSTSASATGSISTNYIFAEGTSAPTTGGSIGIVQVRLRSASPNGSVTGVVYSNGQAENLGTIPSIGGLNVYGGYATLATPSGGWTWQKINDLEVKVWKDAGTGSNFSIVEVRVVSIGGTGAAPLTGGTTYYWRVRAKDPTNTNTFGAWSSTRSFVPSAGATYTLTHTTDAFKKKTATLTHTTDANKKLATVKTHTTDSLKRKQFTLSHTTDANKKKTLTLTHTTDANKKKSGLTLSHSTDANKKKSGNTKFHTTDANKKAAGVLKTHTTDAFLRKQFTKVHTTDANKRLASVKTHTTDANKRLATVKSHTTDANKKLSGILKTHTTDALLRKQFTKTHTTDSLKRKQFTLTHTTDSLKRTATTKVHTTDANKKKSLTLTHTTSANKRLATVKTHTTDANKKTSGLTKTHTTDALKRVSGITKTHTTDAFLRKQFTKTHTTDSLKRKAFTLTHTTDANKKLATVKSHTTDANKKKAGILKTHTTDANKRVSGLLRTHTTDALKRTITTKTHTTDSFLRKQFTKTHTTDSNLRKTVVKTHTTDANLRKVTLKTHTTDANKRVSGNLKTHTTDALKRTANTRTHTTDALKRKQFTLSHTTDSFIKKTNIRSHTTDTNKRLATLKTHTTDANKRKALTLTHTTDALKRVVHTLTHTTDSFLRKQFTKSHTTDSFIRTGFFKTYTTDANKRKALTVSHTADANKRKATLVSHTTDANKRKSSTLTHTTDALKRKAFTLTHTTDALKRKQFVLTHTTDANRRKATTKFHTTDSNLRKATLKTHTTDSNRRKALAVTHTTDALKRKVSTLTHTTDALKRISGITKSHTTDAFLKRSIVKTHTTDANKRKVSSVSHTTDSNKKKSGLFVTHTTDANKRKTFTLSHTTDALKRKAFAITHTTDALLRKAFTKTHSTDANKRLSTVKSHTTDANKKKATTLTHTTDALKRTTGLTKTHTTDALLRKQFIKTHTTDSNKRRATTLSHTTDALKRKANTLSHTTDTNKRRVTTVSHTTDSNLKKSGITKTHSTDANKRKALSVSHTTSANKRLATLKTHTTDALKRRIFTLTHATDSNRRKASILTHTTDSFKRKANVLSHTTDSNKRKAITISHTTDSYIGYDDYSREDLVSLPTTDNALATRYTGSERTDVAVDDNTTYVGMLGFSYLVHEFKHKNTNNTSTITPTCNLKTTLAPTLATVYLQVFNQNSGLWETIDSNSAASANTDFTLTGSVTTSVTNYYTTGNWVSCRVYQRAA